MKSLVLTICIVIALSLDAHGAYLGIKARSPADACQKFPALGPLNSSTTNQVSPSAGNNNGTDESTEWPIPSETSLKSKPGLAHRMNDDDHLQAASAVAKGKALWDLLLETLNNDDAQDAEVCDLSNRWDVDGDNIRKYELRFPWSRILAGPLGFSETSPPDDLLYQVDITAPKGATIPDWGYHSSYAPALGVIEVHDIKGVSFQDPQVRAPDRWSDVTWSFWVQICAQLGDDPKGLRFILQDNIANPTTEAIQHQIAERRRPPNAQSHFLQFDDVLPGEDDFYALLGSPNVVGTVYMLMRNTNALGRKTIKRIGSHVIGETYDILIELEDAPRRGESGVMETS